MRNYSRTVAVFVAATYNTEAANDIVNKHCATPKPSPKVHSLSAAL